MLKGLKPTQGPNRIGVECNTRMTKLYKIDFSNLYTYICILAEYFGDDIFSYGLVLCVYVWFSVTWGCALCVHAWRRNKRAWNVICSCFFMNDK